MSGLELGAAAAAGASAGAGATAAGAGTAGAVGAGAAAGTATAAGAAGAAGTAGAAGAGMGAGMAGAGGLGTAGALGTGFYGIPLAAEGGAMTVGAGNALGWGGGAAAGELGSGLAGIAMPTAAETAAPWYASILSGAKQGADNYTKVNTVMRALAPQQQGGAVMMDSGPMFSGQRQQISPYSQPQSRGNNLVLMLEEQRRRGLLG